MPIIQLDVQPLTDQQRSELRIRITEAVHRTIGSPYAYINVAIHESAVANLVEAGGWGPYHNRQPLEPAHGGPEHAEG
jgi:phenylpyruvate tautomerase PptA (4-oxalocrotonate tautomerase family)